MIEKKEIINILTRGVRKICGRYSPPCNQELCKNYYRSSHPSREFLFVLSGESFYLCNDSVYPCTPGTLFLLDSGMPHGHRYTRDDNNLLHLWGFFHERQAYLCVLEVRCSGHEHPVREMSHFVVPDGLRRQIEERWNLLCQLENAGEKEMEIYMKTPINAVLDEMAFRLSIRQENMQSHTLMEELQEYIRSRNGRACSLEHLAGLSGYSREYLAHKFRSETGMTVGEYINSIRLEYTRIARKRGVRQKEIAYELGFSSPAAFWNWYQKHRPQD